MPWVRAEFKGQRVWAEALADGSLAANDGRVAVRYRRDSAATVYRAGADRVRPLGGAPEDLPDGRPADDAGPARSGARPAARSSGFGSAGSRTAAQAAAALSSARDLVATLRPDAAVCFTDGACEGNPGLAGAGALVRLPDGRTFEESLALGMGTNNLGELSAIGLALDLVDRAKWPPKSPVEIFTDSKYAHGVLTLGWKARANTELVLGLRERLAARRCALHWVAGHVGLPENERADELAREGVANSRGARR